MATIEALEEENSVVSNLALCDLASMLKDKEKVLTDGGSKNLLMRYKLLDEKGKMDSMTRGLLPDVFQERANQRAESPQK